MIARSAMRANRQYCDGLRFRTLSFRPGASPQQPDALGGTLGDRRVPSGYINVRAYIAFGASCMTDNVWPTGS